MQPVTLLLLALGLSVAASGTAAGATPSPPPPTLPATCALPTGPLPTRTRAVFVLDTSGSMRGIGDGRADIFGRVRAELNRYVRESRPDRVELLTFDAGLRTRRGFDRPAGTPGWNTALRRLKADGSNTYLYRSLRAALEPLTGGEQYVTTVFVLTDGIDNDSLRPFTAAQALAAFAERGPLDRLHYLALGTRIPADARRALLASDYADGRAMPLGQVPRLGGPGLGIGLRRVNSLASVRLPLADSTRVRLSAPGNLGLTLKPDVVRGGKVRLSARGNVPYGAAALLCADAQALPGSVAAKPQQVLLRLNTTSPLTLLNPGADRELAQGEETVLRYRATSGVRLNDLTVGDLPPGLSAVVSRAPDSREFAVRLVNSALTPGQTVTPLLILPGGAEVTLPAVLGRVGGRAPYAAAPISRPSGAQAGNPSPQATRDQQDQDQEERVGSWAALIGGLEWIRALVLLALAAGAAFWLLARRRRGGGVWRPLGGSAAVASARLRPVLRPQATPQNEPPAVEGIEYSGGRVLSLVAAGGEVTPVPIPLGGPFDLGQLARVPHLSGLRAEQHRDGLKILRVPTDLDVSQGARLIEAGDVVRPGTLLGVAVGRTGRAPQHPLGTLAGLGQPLTLHREAIRQGTVNVRAAGPYGQHTVKLPPGPSDLGAAFGAPALEGLMVTLSGPNVLLVEVPDGLRLRRSGETAPLQPGSYLPDLTLVDLPDGQ
ncbi:VWA domain-containing protein [Deinococcus sp. AJ005]|uniref:vWA domain-containing protein n=1 Tax=Deinococcus sp. AJ005 TaxID=2652443 RepID=UPI00125CB30D|nr:VWA domain-containing protein [Deinococcus sp. AJ005]QFP76834.1 VWA domain-containing protein [Deinococcus sp. AJ005]